MSDMRGSALKPLSIKSRGNYTDQKILSENIPRAIIIFTLFSTFSMFCTAFVEASLGSRLYSLYSNMKNTYYYYFIYSYIKDVDLIFEFSLQGEKKCNESNLETYLFGHIERLEGVCVKQNNGTDSSFSIDFDGNYNQSECTATSINFKSPISLKKWGDETVCFNKTNNYDLNFSFKKKCDEGSADCGGYGGYRYCLKDRPICPVFSIFSDTTPQEEFLKSKSIVSELISTNLSGLYVYKLRNISEYLHSASFILEFSYNNSFYYQNKSYFSGEYVNFFLNKYIDFRFINPVTKIQFPTIFKKTKFIINQKDFITRHFGDIKNSMEIGNKNAIVSSYPTEKFIFNYKNIKLPEAKCLPYFEDKNYFQKLQILFLDFLGSTLAKYITWSIVEIIFIIIFEGYILGYIRLRQIRRMKLNHHDKLSEAVTHNVVCFCQLFIIIMKYFALAYSKIRMNKKLDFLNLLIEKECYDDNVMTIVLGLYKDFISLSLSYIEECLIINTVRISVVGVNFLLYLYQYYYVKGRLQDLNPQKQE